MFYYYYITICIYEKYSVPVSDQQLPQLNSGVRNWLFLKNYKKCDLEFSDKSDIEEDRNRPKNKIRPKCVKNGLLEF